jgi:UDP-glucose 4-epimerase
MKLPFTKALVTGGAGFIGSHIAEALTAAGCRVTVIDNLSTGHRANIAHIQDRISFYEADICDTSALKQAAAGCEVIFHLAALVSVPQSVKEPMSSARINDMATLQLMDIARHSGVKRVVYSGSSAVYGDDPRMPKTEEMIPMPLSPYAVHKLAGEYYGRIYHRLHGLETVTLRYFNVFGPRQDPSSPYSGVISIFMDKAFSGGQPTIYGDGNQTRDFVFVKDVVKANLLAASTEGVSGRVFNIGLGSCITINALWQMISELSGHNISAHYGQARAGDIRDSLSDISQAEAFLGFAPEYTFNQGLRITLEWYKTHPNYSM